MKQYPEIPKDVPSFNAHVFDKIDGSNLRFEYSKKRGWFKFGTRTRLFDQSDDVFGSAVPLFHETLLFPLTQIMIDNRFEHAVVFAEFAGKRSFAGQHEKDDVKTLTVFDVALDKKGFVSPKMFIKLFDGKVLIPKYLGYYRWNKEFTTKIYYNEIEGITFEGVVGKDGEGTHYNMAKAKTLQWLNKVHALYSDNLADKIINS
jgi:hypothetical protein